MHINRQNLKWAGRMMLILLLVAAAEVLVVLFFRKPLPWVAIIPAILPVLTSFFVIFPMIRAEKPATPRV